MDDHKTRRSGDGGGGRGDGGGGGGDDDDDAHVGDARSAPRPHGAGVLTHSRQSGVHSGVLSVWFVRRDVCRVRGVGRPPRRRQGRPVHSHHRALSLNSIYCFKASHDQCLVDRVDNVYTVYTTCRPCIHRVDCFKASREPCTNHAYLIPQHTVCMLTNLNKCSSE